MKKALVTGANGFVGSALTKELLKNGIEVVALDRGSCNNNIPKAAKFVPFDLSNINEITKELAKFSPDTYYHLAWAGMNGVTRGDPSIQLMNTKWTIDALKQAEQIGCKKFICAGSIMEDEAVAAAYEPGNTPGMACVYGAAKLAAHSMAMYAAQKMNVELVWARITNTYGVGEISSRFINTTLRKIINNESLQFTAATQNYDFIYIDDTVRAFRLIGEKGKPFGCYMIGSSSPRALKDYILEIKKELAPEKEFVFGTIPFTGVNTSLEGFDCSLTEKDTGFKAEISFADGIKRTMKWIKENNNV